jgi:hypothetical protein
MTWFRYGLILFLFLGLTGCALEDPDPQLIASYPNVDQVERYAGPPQGLVVVYNAHLEIEVLNVNRAADKAIAMAGKYGGFLNSSQSWYQDGELNTRLILAVPVIYFEDLHLALLGLGDLVSERVDGDLRPPGYGKSEWQAFSQITLHLHPKAGLFSSGRLPDWHLLNTFRSAVQVAGAIFGFLLDILIWIVVVAGPFVLGGWIVVALLRRRSRKTPEKAD